MFELLGVKDARRRAALIDRLYLEVAMHYRAIRIVEAQKMEQRRQGGKSKVSPLNLAFSAWEELEPEWQMPLALWLEEQAGQAKIVELPDSEVRLPDATNFFEATTVCFGRKPVVSYVCGSRDEAELIAAVAQVGLRGPVSIPISEKECRQAHAALDKRLTEAKTKLEKLAQQYSGTDKLREQVADILNRWFIHGKGE